MWTRPFIAGSAAAAATAALAFSIARWGFGRLFWLGALIPSAALFFLLVAWFLHLREDGFFRQPPRAAGGDDGPGAARPRNRDGSAASSRVAQRSFLVAAIELALLAAALYRFAGIGASYFF